VRVFADSYYFIALLNARDPAHVRVARESQSEAWKLVTAWWVLAEVADAFSAPSWRPRVVALFDRLARHREVFIRGDSDRLFQRGFELYRNRLDKHWSLTDCISFVVMEQEGIHVALTGDAHFAQAGFVAQFAN
jgi:predicted nucleic acid-binding protein